LTRDEARRVVDRLTGQDSAERDVDERLLDNPWFIRRQLDRELDAALLADSYEHRHVRERMPVSAREREEAEGSSVAANRRQEWRDWLQGRR
jgi:hypothetical protein